jgi:hypothetical protein
MIMMMTMKNKGQCAREEMPDCIRRREYMMPCNMRAMKNLQHEIIRPSGCSHYYTLDFAVPLTLSRLEYVLTSSTQYQHNTFSPFHHQSSRSTRKRKKSRKGRLTNTNRPTKSTIKENHLSATTNPIASSTYTFSSPFLNIPPPTCLRVAPSDPA